MKSKIMLNLFCLFSLILSCTKPAEVPVQKEDTFETGTDTILIKYLALGDSYTIGHGVEESDRFPVQLAHEMTAFNIFTEELTIVARTGWTTDELKSDLLKRDISNDYDLVTLLIGVNNQYRGRSLEEFATQFEELLQMAIQYAGNDTGSVIVLSIPDYGVTPFGRNRDASGKISQDIDLFNSQKEAICKANGVYYEDITEISRLAADDLTLLASDQLHPSGTMYGMWVNKLLEEAVGIVRKQ